MLLPRIFGARKGLIMLDKTLDNKCVSQNLHIHQLHIQWDQTIRGAQVKIYNVFNLYHTSRIY